MRIVFLFLVSSCIVQAQSSGDLFAYKSNSRISTAAQPFNNQGLNKELVKVDSTIAKDSDTSFVYLANQVIITAQRHKANLFATPEYVSAITKKQIQVLSPMSTTDLVSNIPGVWMQKTNHGGGSPYVRGLTGYQTLLVLDGIRFNNSIFRSGPNQYLNTIDPYTIESVEVLHGQGSVQYGSDGIGGTIQVFSRELPFAATGWQVKGNVLAKLISHDMEKTGRVEVSAASNQLAFQAGFTHKDFGNIYAGGDRGTLLNTGYNEHSWDFKSRIKLTAKQELSLLYHYVSQHNIPVYHQLVTGNYLKYQTTLQQRNMTYVRLTSSCDKKWVDEIKYTLSFQRGKEVRDRQSVASVVEREEIDKIRTIGASAEIVSTPFSQWSISSGVEFYTDGIGSQALNKNLQTNEQSSLRGLYPDDSNYRSAGIFSLHTFNVNRFIITAGLRFNVFALEVKDETVGATTINPRALVGNAGVVYKLSKSIHLVTTAGTGFRSPNINDVASLGITDFRYEVPNYGLTPEKSFQYQAGIKMKERKTFASIYWYENRISDLIINRESTYQGQDSVDGIKVYQRFNSDRAVVKGLELEVQHQLTSSININGSITYTIGENTTRQEPLSRIPPAFGRLAIAYKHKSIKAMADVSAAGKQDRLSSGDAKDSRIAKGGTPGWWVTNLRVQYEVKAATVQLSALNVFNAAYRIHGSGVDGIGRSYSLIVAIHF
jgi:hemoglobin/transferrin/lactoferrin receptor protein